MDKTIIKTLLKLTYISLFSRLRNIIICTYSLSVKCLINGWMGLSIFESMNAIIVQFNPTVPYIFRFLYFEVSNYIKIIKIYLSLKVFIKT